MKQFKRGFSIDQYRRARGNFFTPINRQIERYALNSANPSRIHPNPPCVRLSLSSTTSNAYLLSSIAILVSKIHLKALQLMRHVHMGGCSQI